MFQVMKFMFPLLFSYSQSGRTVSLPSFLRKRQSGSKYIAESAKKKKPVRCWDRDIVCLPKDFGGSSIPIPRGSRRASLGECGLIGKVHLTSDMTEEEVKSEIRSVFRRPMKFDPSFPFTFLQSTGCGTKTLTSPAVSIHFQWTAQQVVSLAGQGALYILANKELDLPVSIKMHTCMHAHVNGASLDDHH
jgi:hypothetical protein